MRIRCIVLTLAASLVALSALAQDPALEPIPHEPQGPQRKRPSLWYRPVAATPATQLQVAEALVKEGRLRKALRRYEGVVRNWHASPEAVVAQQRRADLMERRGKYQRAFEELQYLVDFFPGEFDYEALLEQQFRIAQRVMTRRRGRILFYKGYTAPTRALPLFRQLADNGPGWSRAPEVQFFIGWVEEQARHWMEAIAAYEVVQQRWPKHETATSAAYGRARALTRVARSNLRDEVGLREALSALSVALRDYPDAEEAEEATEMRDALNARLARMSYERAEFYDRVAKRPEAALIAYQDFLRRFPYTSYAETVASRVAELERDLEATPDL